MLVVNSGLVMSGTGGAGDDCRGMILSMVSGVIKEV